MWEGDRLYSLHGKVSSQHSCVNWWHSNGFSLEDPIFLGMWHFSSKFGSSSQIQIIPIHETEISDRYAASSLNMKIDRFFFFLSTFFSFVLLRPVDFLSSLIHNHLRSLASIDLCLTFQSLLELSLPRFGSLAAPLILGIFKRSALWLLHSVTTAAVREGPRRLDANLLPCFSWNLPGIKPVCESLDAFPRWKPENSKSKSLMAKTAFSHTSKCGSWNILASLFGHAFSFLLFVFAVRHRGCSACTIKCLQICTCLKLLGWTERSCSGFSKNWRDLFHYICITSATLPLCLDNVSGYIHSINGNDRSQHIEQQGQKNIV